MRLRFTVLASVVTALMALAIPSVGNAAPKHNRGLTINATPNPILAGEGVLIYGQLNDPPVSGQTIVLYHHIAGIPGYSRVGATTTATNGFYEFTRAENVVMTNRNWFVREEGVHRIHSRTVRERAAALVSISPNQSSQFTRKPIVFTGHVTPNHAFERVYLQTQIGSSDEWHTIKSGLIGPGSDYAIAYRFRFAGVYSVRAVFRGDNRNIRGESDPVAVTIDQAQVPDFTITSSSPIITDGSSVTISGKLDQAGTSTAEPTTPVTLFARTVGGNWTVVGDTTTGTDGTYSFSPLMPTSNTLYQVRTTFKPARHSAVLYEGVKDVLTLTPSSPSAMVGQTVTFTGTVLPDKAGDVVYLQRLGKDGEWHAVEVRLVRNNSTFQFSWTFGNSGPHEFRARIPGDSQNVGGASMPVSINVTLAPGSGSLPPAS
ncbi:MAG: hypothetical protein ACR2L9_09055 [Solirubrobacteraceae bacterium]